MLVEFTLLCLSLPNELEGIMIVDSNRNTPFKYYFVVRTLFGSISSFVET